MGFTWVSLVVIPLTVYLFLTNKSRLLFLTVFLIPFETLSIYNSVNGSPIFASFFCGMMWIFRLLIDLFVSKKIFCRTYLGNRAIIISLIALIVLSILSVFFISGQLVTLRGEGLGYYHHLIEFNLSYILFNIPTLFGLLFALFLASDSNRNMNTTELLKCFMYSVFFCILWGVFQFISLKFDLFGDFIYIFNTSIAPTTLGTKQEYEEVIRISSNSFEPAMFAKLIIVFLVALWSFRSVGIYLFGKVLDYVALIFSLFALYLTMSTAGIIGLFLIAALGVILFLNVSLRIVLRWMLGFFAMVACIYWALDTSSVFQEFIDFSIVNKLESASALARLISIDHALEIFSQHYIFGVGWGNVTVHSLILYVLANTGIIGFVFFLAYFSEPMFFFIKNRKELPRINPKMRAVLLHTIGAHTILALLGVFSGFEFYLLHSYFTYGLFISTLNTLKPAQGCKEVTCE